MTKDYKYTLDDIFEIVDNGTKNQVKALVDELGWGYPYKGADTYRLVFRKFVQNTTGSVRVKALINSDNLFGRKEFDSYLSLLNDTERLKVLSRSLHYTPYYPEEFVKIWNDEPRKRGAMLEKMPHDGSKYKGFDTWEETFQNQERQRDYVLNLVDGRIFEAIEATILDSSGAAKASYAYERWANPEILDALKDDSSRKVVNYVAMNPFINFDTAVYLITNHKTPVIRESIAENTRTPEILQMIWDSTKSEEIRKYVRNNPYFKYTGIES